MSGKPKVLVPVADGTEEMEAVTIVDTLVRGGAEVRVASVMVKKEVHCARGIKIHADCLIDECTDENWDLIAIPGGMPGAQHLSDCHPLIHLLKAHHSNGKLIGAICAAPAVVLAKHGILRGPGTCYPGEKFTSMLPSYDARHNVVVHENIVTSKGPGTALEFSLKLVSELIGHEKSEQLKREMIYTN
jgi:4-methyl-5(b-hydroxyethyl)-thiazole monophosphate biosynthesis